MMFATRNRRRWGREQALFECDADKRLLTAEPESHASELGIWFRVPDLSPVEHRGRGNAVLGLGNLSNCLTKNSIPPPPARRSSSAQDQV